MKVVLMGNAGAGKSTLARTLTGREAARRLSLDELAFSAGTDRRPLDDSIADALRFVESNRSWIVEGCYADIIEPLLNHAEYLVFLNPGVEVCVEHCMARPWEPEKFDTMESQNANLANLVGWVRQYEVRDDEYGLKRHRALYESFAGPKVEYTNVCDYGVGLLPAK